MFEEYNIKEIANNIVSNLDIINVLAYRQSFPKEVLKKVDKEIWKGVKKELGSLTIILGEKKKPRLRLVKK